jgi:hypothetical protein
VQYSSKPLIENAIQDSEGTYDKSGFLYEFSQTERDSIKPVTHKVLLNDIDKADKSGGNEQYKFNRGKPSEALMNYDSAWYKMVTDKVYLLSVKELKEFVEDRGFEWLKDNPNTLNPYDWYWLRTPTEGGFLCCVYPEGKGYVNGFDPANTGNIGVCPAVNLSMNSIMFESGSGSKDKPYVVKSK